jgi:hypothetical protein
MRAHARTHTHTHLHVYMGVQIVFGATTESDDKYRAWGLQLVFLVKYHCVF